VPLDCKDAWALNMVGGGQQCGIDEVACLRKAEACVEVSSGRIRWVCPGWEQFWWAWFRLD
jgi:hypothetical protein